MKATALISILFVCGAAQAAGEYDGIYADLTNPNAYFSVHTNGNRIITSSYSSIPASNIQFQSLIGNVAPTQLNIWDLLGGTINGNIAQISGRSIFEACELNLTIKFEGSEATGFITSSTQTLVGKSSNVNCAALTSAYPNGMRFSKIF